MSEISAHHDEHRDDEGSKLGMWLFIFTELLLFGGLFIVYSVYRYKHAQAFSLAASELDVTMGTINTVILLISSMTIAMATIAGMGFGAMYPDNPVIQTSAPAAVATIDAEATLY